MAYFLDLFHRIRRNLFYYSKIDDVIALYLDHYHETKGNIV